MKLSPGKAPPIHFRVEAQSLSAHLFSVSMTMESAAAQQIIRLASWIPGSYLVREFARNVQSLAARQGRKSIAVQQLDKDSWQLDCKAGSSVTVSYEIYAFDNSVRMAWLDSQRGFFNGTSLFMQAVGQTDQPHGLTVSSKKLPPKWKLATGLKASHIDKRGFGGYLAADFDELADCPVEMGDFFSSGFDVLGIPHRFVISGSGMDFDADKLIADTKAICETQMNLWHPEARNRAASKAPMQSFLFMLNAVHDGHGGLEHRNSTALIAPRRSLPAPAVKTQSNVLPSDDYVSLLGLISHEYFHTWNVKKLRPHEFARYDYNRENHTELLWFFEGFTSYYDDLFLRRTHRVDNAQYLKLLCKSINQLESTPGRKIQPVAKASFDAWTKYYRPDENTPNSTVSYYTKGALIALCLDLTLRQKCNTNLDAVMRDLWKRCKAGPMRQQDLLEALLSLTGRSFDAEINAWVHSTDELPITALLEAQGVNVLNDPAPFSRRLGMRVKEEGSVLVQHVMRGSAAEDAGFTSADEWLGIELADGSMWRIQSLDDVLLYSRKAKRFTALVSRDRRICKLTVAMKADATITRLSIREPGLVNAWLDS